MKAYITDTRAARQEIRKNVDIIQVITDELGPPPKVTGSDSFWCCPFHGENSPSFGVHKTLQIYKCFGCHVGGDVVAFVQNFQGISVQEAIDTIATKYSVDISQYLRPPTAEELQRFKYQVICEEAAKFCTASLLTNKSMLDWYKQDSGFDLDQIVTYDVGYCLDHNQLMQHIHKTVNGVTQDDLDKLEFTNRLMWDNAVIYPIRDSYGKVAAFRNKPLTPPPDFGGKYVGTTSRHPLFTHKLLYGFHALRSDLRQSGYVVRVCEGQKAAIASGGCAQMGTSLHEEQIQLLRDHGVKKVIFSYDGDSAGRAASVRLLEQMNEFAGMQVMVVQMPDGDQPDGYMRKHGKKGLDALFNCAVLPIQFYIDQHRDATGKLSVEDKFALVERLRDYLVKIPDVHMEMTAEYLGKALSVDPIAIKTFVIDNKLVSTGLMNRDAEQAVLQYTLLNPKIWSTVRQAITEAKSFTSIGHQHLFTALDSAHKKARDASNPPESVTVQVARDEIKIVHPHLPELPKIIDSLLMVSPKYEFQDALQRMVDLHRRRTGIEQSRVLQAELGDMGRTTNEILSKYRKNLVSSIEVKAKDLGNPISLADSVKTELESRMHRQSGVIGYDFSKLRDVDGVEHPGLTGLTLALSGLQKQHQVIISAYSGVGKSLLGLQMATAISVCPQPQDQVPTLWIALEMNETEISMRQISMLSGVDNSKVQSGMFNAQEWTRVQAAIAMQARGQFYVKKPRFGHIDEIFAIIDEYNFKYGVKAAFLDYIQLIAPGPSDRGMSREEVIGRASKVMKNQVAESMGLVSICIAQQNRQGYQAGETGSIQNIGGSYQIAQDADDVLLLQEKTAEQMSEARDRGNRIAFLDKRRGGTSDVKFDLDLDTSKMVSLRWNECIDPGVLMGLAKAQGLKV